ncbi:MAG TPA: deoxyribose-phosphate aldolase [Tepidisphaeraceae bacterium]|nr:deoxyribose-phosphate aldolase [Tepidisphaeraceae bacterium]
MTSTELARRIDHTILRPDAQAHEVHQVVTEAVTHDFASVCVAPAWVGKVSPMLAGTGVACCTVIGFPNGTNRPTVKAIEATAAVKEGATEIDVVAFLPFLINCDVDSAKRELTEIVRAARAVRPDVTVKVIAESALLVKLSSDTDRVIEAACRAVRESGCDYIKTSTGFHPAGGASVDVVRRMKKYGEGLLVKASGGIRDLATALAMIDAGADRLGMSASISVINELAGASGVATLPGTY